MITPTVASTSLSTSLSAGAGSGSTISVPSGTAVTDSATLSGTNASSATGTVTYYVYSDSACSVLVSGGSAQMITTPGTLPPSAAVTITTPGTYYWQAVYSGDSSNATSTSTCGSEVETVTALGKGADLVLTIQAPSTVTPTVGFPVSLTVTNDGPQTATDILAGLSVSPKLLVVNPGENSHKLGRILYWYQSYGLPAGQSVTWTVWLCSTATATGNALIPAAAVSLNVPDPNYKNNFAADAVTFDPAMAAKQASIAADRRYNGVDLLARLHTLGRVLRVHNQSRNAARQR